MKFEIRIWKKCYGYADLTREYIERETVKQGYTNSFKEARVTETEEYIQIAVEGESICVNIHGESLCITDETKKFSHIQIFKSRVVIKGGD